MDRNQFRILFSAIVAIVILFVGSNMPAIALERIVVNNGDFSSGNTAFSSDYGYVADVPGVNNELESEGFYSVGYSAYDFHWGWVDGTDHTTGDGLMFIANGATNTSAIVWQGTPSQDLIVGQKYDLSAWIMDVTDANAHASLTFKADAEVIGTLTCTSYHIWTRLYGSFTATSTRPTLTLTNAQSAAIGNDFAVDDINIYYEASTTPPTEAALTTLAAASVSQTSATLGGNITSDGGNAITERGVVYSSTDTKPYIGDAGVTQDVNGAETSEFSESIGSLAPGTTYYYQAYAINAQGTAYGGIETFTTDNVNVTFTNGSSFTPDVTRGSTDQVIGRFQLTGDVAGASLTDAAIKLNGTRTGLSNLKLWASADATFGSDSQIGSTVGSDPGDGNSATFSSFSSSIGIGGTWYFLTGDVASDATGVVQGVIVENAGLTLDKGTVSGSLSNEPLSNGDASLPVELSSFSARSEGQTVVLEWVTESETDNLGFILERSQDKTSWAVIASYQTCSDLEGQGNTTSRTEYAFTDETAAAEAEYTYRLSDVNIEGQQNVIASTSVYINALPQTTQLFSAYPNPFNPSTTLAYQLAKEERVEISVYNTLGSFIKTLYSSNQPAGSYQVNWNGTDENGSKVPSGAYLIRMQTDKVTQTQKVLLVK